MAARASSSPLQTDKKIEKQPLRHLSNMLQSTLKIEVARLPSRQPCLND
jgi:hypothetical protein